MPFLDGCNECFAMDRVAERIVTPRHWDVFASSPDSAVGTASIVMAICMLPAIPFANSLPAAPDITMALGLSGHDGAWLAVAVVASIVSTVIEVSIFAAGSFAISILFRKRVP